MTQENLKRVSAILVMLLVMSSFASEAHARIYGIPGIIILRTTLQNAPGTAGIVIDTLDQNQSIQVLCKTTSDSGVKTDTWWLKVHVWDQNGYDGWVPDYYVHCKHVQEGENCPIPFCV